MPATVEWWGSTRGSLRAGLMQELGPGWSGGRRRRSSGGAGAAGRSPARRVVSEGR